MRELHRPPGENEVSGREYEASGTEAEKRNLPEKEASGDFDLSVAEDEVRGSEVRMNREIDSDVAEVKEQISKAFEQARRVQDKFADEVRKDRELSGRLGRFLEFQAKLRQEER